MAREAIAYATAGALTDLARVPASALEGLPGDPVALCRPVSGLVIQPNDAKAEGMPAERFRENQIRPAATIIEALLTQDPASVKNLRPPEKRVIGTCRHFAVLSCALLRQKGIPARVRCGFATYFQPGLGLDHWITEYWHGGDGRWVRIDSEVLGRSVVEHPEDLAPGTFLSGGEAWVAFREARIDAERFGVPGTENWGPGEIRGNAVKDLAASNKVEMLPWDEWGRMTASYQGQTGPEYDELHDTIARVCAADDPAELAKLYASEDLRVPAELIR